MPPPLWWRAIFPLKVLFMMVSVPPLQMPPPSSADILADRSVDDGHAAARTVVNGAAEAVKTWPVSDSAACKDAIRDRHTRKAVVDVAAIAHSISAITATVAQCHS